jgi:hypothetical protein
MIKSPLIFKKEFLQRKYFVLLFVVQDFILDIFQKKSLIFGINFIVKINKKELLMNINLFI